MVSKKQVEEDLQWFTYMETIIGAYEEVAARRMQQIRSAVLQNRLFLEEINQMFHHVKRSYKKEVSALMKKYHSKNSNTFAVTPKNGKTVRVLLSSNASLYGGIVHKTFQLFLNDIQHYPSDVVVLGTVGKQLMETHQAATPFHYFDFPDDTLKKYAIKQIALSLQEYEQIYMYHGIFKSILSQEPVVNNITGDALPALSSYEQTTETPAKWLFEPTLQDVLHLFETEIVSSMLVHSFDEAYLARYASRMATLDQATNHMKTAMKKTRILKNVLHHREKNKKQLAMLSGMTLWNTR